jgi:NADH-quinone oxidoreductase subunit M
MSDFLQLISAGGLTTLVFFPALAALPLLFMGSVSTRTVKIYALVASLVELAIAWPLTVGRITETGVARLVEPSQAEPMVWIRALGVRYELYLDGIAMPLVLLSAVLLPIVLLGSWNGIERNWRGYAASMMVLTAGIMGALLARDMFLFYIFWEVMLVPMYLIIGIWGGERRIYAAIKFFLFTMAGSLLMLLSIIWMAWSYKSLAGGWSFHYDELMLMGIPVEQQIWLFAAFALAFAIKVPMFPFHTWLPDAHVEAPTGGSVILAGVLLKLGTYGFLRFALPLFPHASQQLQGPLIVLALVGIIYGALLAWVQTDMKKLVAYSSVAHLGFVMLGLLAVDLMAWEGALIQMINHGLSTGALFLLVGMLYERRHTKKFEDFGGLAKVMPCFAFFLVFSTLASVGLPALNGFVGEFLILVGTYQSGLRIPAIIATSGVVLAAIYLLKMLAESIWGPLDNEENKNLKDLSPREILVLVPLCLLMLAIGLVPETFLRPSRADLSGMLNEYRYRVEEPAPEVLTLRSAALMAEADDSSLEGHSE